MSGAAAAEGAGAIVRQGHLRKLKTMKKKYFVLRSETADSSARLEYYESEKKFRANASPRRELQLKSCYNITRRLDLKQKHVIALFTREEQFCVVAENEKDLHDWLSDILKQHRADDNSTTKELLHPIQHVWQVNVQKKGLGASKNIQGLYNLCLTDKTLTLVKIKSHNNIISDLGIPERVEYILKNIRRCGDSECFFYMEVGRNTVTGAGEIWMHTEDSNIAQSMHSTILHAMRNCAKENECDKDHFTMTYNMLVEGSKPPARRQTYSDGRGRAGLAGSGGGAEYQQNNPLISDKEKRVVKHHRTVSLPAGCTLFQEPLKIVHERTRSAPLTGEEVDQVITEKVVRHSSCKTVNGVDVKKPQWPRRASTGARLSKLSPAHTKNVGTLRNRCDSMPSRVCAALPVPLALALEAERAPALARHTDRVECVEMSRDEAGVGAGVGAEWNRTPRIPEEPDYCEMSRGFMSGGASRTSMSVQHSRNSSLTGEDSASDHLLSHQHHTHPSTAGYLPMAPRDHTPIASAASSLGGTPSTDPRFSEYQLDHATSHIIEEGPRAPRAYSVGSRPAARGSAGGGGAAECRHRTYSVGARSGGAAPRQTRLHPSASSSAPLLPRADAGDHMELDFSTNQAKVIVARAATAPQAGFTPRAQTSVDEYVDMSPRAAPAPAPAPPRPATPPAAPAPPPPIATTPDGYVEMNYTPRHPAPGPTRPIAIAAVRHPAAPATPLSSLASLPSPPTPAETHGSQTIFPLSLDSPADALEEVLSQPELEPELPPHPLTTLREISEEGPASPGYVVLRPKSRSTDEPIDPPIRSQMESSPTIVKAGGAALTAARFSVPDEPLPAIVHYASLDLEPRAAAAAPAPRLYTQIDFVRSEKLHADAN